MQHVVAATDLTAASEPAVVRAALASRAMGAELHLLHMLPELLLPLVGDSRVRKAERALLFRAQRLGYEIGCPVSSCVLKGDTARGIVRASEDLGAVLTVFGHKTDGARPPRLLGSTVERSLGLIRNAVLVIRDRSPGQAGYRKALLAPEDGIELRALTPYLRHLAPRAALHQIDLHRSAGGPRPRRKVAEHVRAMCRALDTDLLVIGVPRDETINPFRFRRVLTSLVRVPECDTLIVPQDCAVVPSEAPLRRRIRIAS